MGEAGDSVAEQGCAVAGGQAAVSTCSGHGL